MRKNSAPLFKRTDSLFWFCRVWDSATRRMVRRCTDTADEKKAYAFYERMRKEVETKGIAAIREQKLTLTDLERLLLEHYQINEARTVRRAQQALANLKTFFGEFATVPQIDHTWPKYVEHRKAQAAANGTINYERSVLAKGLRLAQEHKRLATVPVLSRLRVHNVREGFVTDTMMDRIEAELPEDLKAPMRFAYISGWRVGEILSLRWPQVSFEKGIIRLEASGTKTKKARELAFDVIPALADLLKRQWDALEPSPFGPVRWGPRSLGLVFPAFRRGGRAHGGHEIKDYASAWKGAVTRAGYPSVRVHDLRRSAVRNMIAAGVQPQVAMTVTGHRSLAMLNRYAILDTALQRQGLAASRYGQASAVPTAVEPGRVIPLPAR